MAVYIDDMYKFKLGQYRGMKMSHMIADSNKELHDMAKKIGINSKWFQGNHYDVCFQKRKLAIELGAIEVNMKELVRILKNRSSSVINTT